jgi:hypothetical protein
MMLDWPREQALSVWTYACLSPGGCVYMFRGIGVKYQREAEVHETHSLDTQAIAKHPYLIARVPFCPSLDWLGM